MLPVMLVLVACGGRREVLSDADGGVDSGAAVDAGVDAGSADAGQDAGTDAGAALDAGSDAGGGADAGSDAGTRALAATASSWSMYANCMPIVPADPFNISFTVAYDNSAGASSGTATVLSSKVSFSGGSELDLTVSPSEVTVPAGGTMSVEHTKTASTPALSSPCSTCGETASLEAQLDIDGSTETLTFADMTVTCVY